MKLGNNVTTRVLAAVVVLGSLTGASAYALGSSQSEASPPRVTSTEDGNVGSLKYRSGSGLVEVGAEGVVRRKCPKGTYATGGGFAVGGADPNLYVLANRNYDGVDADFVPDDGWEVWVVNNTASKKSVTVRVICSK